MKKRLTLKVVGLALVGAMASGSAMANKHHHSHEGTSASTHGGFKLVHPGDDAYWFSIGGRLNFDEVQFWGDAASKGPQYPSGANIRRAYLKFAGGLGHALSYNLTLDFSGANGVYGTNGSTVDFIDAYFNIAGEPIGCMDSSNLRLGQFSAPSTIDFWGSTGTDNDNMFMEPALATGAFSIPDKVYGVWGDTTMIDMFMLSGSVYQPRQVNSTNNTVTVPATNVTPGNTNYQNPGRDDRVGASIRLAFVPVHTAETVYHLGIVGRYQSMSNTNPNVSSVNAAVSQPNLFAAGPELRARNTAMQVTTGGMRARSYNTVSAEGLAIWGPATVEAELRQANVQRVPTLTVATNSSNSLGNPRFHGWHVQGGYMLTGESRQYNFGTGTLHNPRPEAKCGAWEIAARYSFLNLVDRDVYGGSEHNTTIGLNWFANENVKVALNYVHANIRPSAATGVAIPVLTGLPSDKRTISAVGLRVGVTF